MKKFAILLAALVLFSTLMAVESDPSNIVGYVAYDCVVGTTGSNNFIALPLEAAYQTAYELGQAYEGQINIINTWLPATQAWDFAAYAEGEWIGENFDLGIGSAYMVNIDEEFTFYSVGDLPDPVQYNLIEGTTGNNNFIMLPLDRPDLGSAYELGGDITVANVINKWLPGTQAWDFASYDGEDWIGENFDISIGMPLMINITAPAVWPAN